MPDATGFHRCARCGLTKPTGEFGAAPNRPSGVKSWCKQCTRDERRETYRRNPARFVDAARRWDQANPERRARIRRRWDREHPERWLRDHQRNPEAGRRRRQRWAKANPDAIAEKARIRRAIQRGVAVGAVTTELIATKMAYWGNRCWMCGGTFEHVDHVKPLARGGLHCLANLRPSCGDCNRRKADKWPWDHSATWKSSFRGGADARIVKGHSDGSSVDTPTPASLTA